MASPSWEWGNSSPSSRLDQTFFSFWVCFVGENLKKTIIFVLANDFQLGMLCS
jgi:hypothetical protein